MMHRTLLLHQQGVRNRDLLHYPQILFLGDSLSDKKVILSTVFQECALGNGDEYIKEQLPIQRRFRPNAIIDGQLFRISLLEGVDWIDGEQMLNCVQTLRPDVVIVCLSVSKKNKLIEFKNWSRNLSYLRGIDICWLLAPDKVNGVAELVDRAQFEKSLIQSVAASDMLTEHYFSMVGGMAAVTPRQLVRQLITNARAVRNDVTHRSLASEVSSLFDDALSEF